MTAVVCPCCSTSLAHDHPGRRGILINRKVALGARLVELEWQLEKIPKAMPHLRADMLIRIDEAKAQIAAVTEQLDAETEEPKMTMQCALDSQDSDEPAKVEPPKLDRHPCPLCSHWLGNHKTADDFWICVDCKYRWKVEAARPDLEAIRARAEAATPEPWDAKETGELLPDWHRALLSVLGSHGLCIALSVPVEADADFIAHAREDIPALLDEVARLESALKGWIGDAERLQREVAQLTRERDAAYRKGLQEGFEVAESEAWISTWDGWHVTNPRIDWEAAQKALEKAKAEVKP